MRQDIAGKNIRMRLDIGGDDTCTNSCRPQIGGAADVNRPRVAEAIGRCRFAAVGCISNCHPGNGSRKRNVERSVKESSFNRRSYFFNNHGDGAAIRRTGSRRCEKSWLTKSAVSNEAIAHIGELLWVVFAAFGKL